MPLPLAADPTPAGPPADTGDRPELHAPAPAPGRVPSAVVGGTPAPFGAWDDAVALFGLGQLSCSGTLIAPNLVLTAGHCRAALDYAVVGANDLRSGGEQIPVVDAVAHPDPYTTYDVALITLEHDASVPPRPLALDCVVDGFLHAGAEVTIAGFGATDPWGDEWTEQLHQAVTTIVDPACTDFEAGCNEAVSPGGELIAGGAGVDSCLGDSGGPLYLHTDTAFDGVTEFLAGITSRARLPAKSPCGGGGIYVRADAVAPWIEQTAGITLPRPGCDGFNHPPLPAAPPIEVVQGGTALVIVEPGDADPDQTHTFRLVQAPAWGRTALDPDGGLLYLAPTALPPREALAVVEVTDDGVPPRTGRVEIPIRVTAGTPWPRGCATAPGGGAAWGAVVLAWLGLRSRRR